MELRESKDSILAILFDMFRNHSPATIVNTCEQKQWKIENCIESLLQNDAAPMQGAVPKVASRKNAITNVDNSQEQKILNLIRAGCRVMVIMRGAPGSGKTFLARHLVKNSMPNIKYNDMKNFIFSTDDYFINRRGIYNRQARKLPEAHGDNQRKVEAKAIAGSSPIIIDNTNLQIWEMMPYIEISIKYGYTVELLEPKTPWRHSAEHLALKNAHGVPVEKIKSMLNKFEAATVEQLNKMANNYSVPNTSSANVPLLEPYGTQSKISIPKPRCVENNLNPIPLVDAPLPQRQNFRSRNSQNTPTENSVCDELSTVIDDFSAPFENTTHRVEASNNILDCLNNFTYDTDNQNEKFSTSVFTDEYSNATANVSVPTIERKNEIKEKNVGLIEVQLNSSIISQLNSVFGSEEDNDISFLSETGEFLNVLLPLELAKVLYKLCCQAKHENTQKRRQQADENFAKLIQNSKYSEVSQAPENLQELLDYEMALRLLRLEKEEQQKSSQETLATLLTKLKASENPPETPIQPEKTFDPKTDRIATYGKGDKCLALSDFEEFRNLAVHHCQLKAECYQKAKDMVQKGNNAVAGYYSQIAHFHKKKVDMYNERAANCIVEVHRLTSDNQDLLDLHHLHAAEAIECLDLFLDHHISSVRSSTRTYKNVFIITGRGLHSTGGVSIIKNKVKNRLKDRNLKWNEVNPGLLKVKIFSTSRFSK